MAAHSYDDFLQSAREEFSKAELWHLAEDLKKASSQQNEPVLPLSTGHPWDVMFDSLGKFSDDFMKDRAQPSGDDRVDLFP